MANYNDEGDLIIGGNTRGTWINGVYQNPYSDPAKLAAYDKSRKANYEEMQRQSAPSGWLDKFMDKHLSTIVDAMPIVFAAVATAGAAGAFGSGAAGATGTAGASAASAAAGEAAGAALTNAGLSGTAIGGTTLGASVGASGIPQVIISGAAGGAGTGLGLGGAAAIGAAGLGGLAAMGGGGGAPAFDPNGPIQSVEVPRPAAPQSNVGLGELGAGLGAGLGLGNLPINNGALEQLPNVEPTPTEGGIPQVIIPPPVQPGAGAFPNLPIPILPLPTGVTPGPGGGGTPTTGIPGLSDLIKGLIPILGGVNDYQNSKEDTAWWKSQLDELSGMYKPGTPEAEQMRQKMEARDAASGRRSQYGVREMNLATNLAEKRSGIMTSAGYQNMANAYRNRSSQDLNGLFGAAGNANTQNALSGLISGLGGLFKG